MSSRAQLIESRADVEWTSLDGLQAVGLTAGASAPDSLIDELVDAFRERYDVQLEEVATARENIHFRLPASVREEAVA